VGAGGIFARGAGSVFGAANARVVASIKVKIGALGKMTATFLFQSPGGVSAILGNPLTMMIIVMGIFYVMLHPSSTAPGKKVQAMLLALKNGDKIITSSGIYGTVTALTATQLF